MLITFTSILFGLILISTSTTSTSGNPLEALVGNTVISDGIAWIKAFGCVDNDGAEGTATFNYLPPFNNIAGFINYAQYAVSIKFESPSGVYSAYAVECSDPIWALNNGKEIPYTLDKSTANILPTPAGLSQQSNWITKSSAMWNEQLRNTCVNDGITVPFPLDGELYHSCGIHGVVIRTGLNNARSRLQCTGGDSNAWDVYLGFDPSLATDCDGNTYAPPPIDSSGCGILAIDNFLLQCSTEYTTLQTLVNNLDSTVSTLSSSMTTVETNSQTNADDIAQLELDVVAIQADTTVLSQITTIQQDIIDTNDRIDDFSSFGAARSNGGGLFMDDLGSNSNGVTSDIILILLFTLNLACFGNLFMMIYTHCGSKKAQKYVVVDQDNEL